MHIFGIDIKRIQLSFKEYNVRGLLRQIDYITLFLQCA